jgi:hypothetical protein
MAANTIKEDGIYYLQVMYALDFISALCKEATEIIGSFHRLMRGEEEKDEYDEEEECDIVQRCFKRAFLSRPFSEFVEHALMGVQEISFLFQFTSANWDKKEGNNRSSSSRRAIFAKSF